MGHCCMRKDQNLKQIITAGVLGFEPRITVLETVVLSITPYPPSISSLIPYVPDENGRICRIS